MSKTMAVLDENKKVINIIICDQNESETETLIAYTDENPAYIGGDYFEGYFYPEQPFPDWIRNKGFWIDPNEVIES